MAKVVSVGQVAEWFKATVLKTPQGERLKAPNPRISNSYRPRMMRTERTPQRFAMAQMSAQNNRAGKPLARLPALTAHSLVSAINVGVIGNGRPHPQEASPRSA